MDFYDIYGFIFGVDGPARDRFREEYGRFAITSRSANIDLLIMEYKGGKSLPIHPKGERWGLKLPTSKLDKTMIYNTRLNPNFVLAMFEGYLTWPDKVLLHAGAVARGNEALVFTGGGNVGKTSLVLQALRREYEYLSDDWLIIGDGIAYPLPKRVRVFDYNLIHDKKVRQMVLGTSAWLKSPLINAHYRIRRFLTRIAPHPYFKRALGVLRPIYRVDIEKLIPGTQIGDASKIKTILYLERSDVASVAVKGISPQLLAIKMTAINFFERSYFFQQYFLASFLNGADDKIQIGKRLAREKKIMQDTFNNTSVYHIQIPNRMSPEVLWDILVKEGLLK